ncbi:hypothetical protein BKA67DRAFT_666422 [Truncatella angustata]|uniref:Uncharacterized protein n=1 Tax=Truncatella angustata TaxID=152316 RepID=A0A9P8UWD5_9PEZI|nr:uncharacterized protein BKA67DRAFT_666422 [Truncatella angustata]KAH6659623.1 hypothetical protein BKA67DRAFT_666422 [Truncatella angustata]
MDRFGWAVEQQRHILEETGRSARDELRHEIGSLRQQLMHAGIREEFLSKSVDRHRVTEIDLMRQLVDAESQLLQARANTAALEDEWMLEQQRLFQQLQTPEKVRNREDEPYREDQDEWMIEQQRRYHLLQSRKESALVDSPGADESVYSPCVLQDPPPSYHEHFDNTRLDYDQVEPTAHHERIRQPSRQIAQVHFADPLEILLNPSPPSMPKVKKKQEAKRQIIGLCRRRINRTAVGFLALTLT